MPKKKAYNAFYYFMKDFQRREEAKGRVFNSMSQVSAAAGYEWQKFTDAEKKPYNVRAKEMKGKGEVKYTSLGENVELVNRREQQIGQAQKDMEFYIENFVKNNMINEGFADAYFYIIEVNCYCYVTSLERYYPAEIAIVRFNLRHGVEPDDVYHRIIDCGVCPVTDFSRDPDERGRLPMGYQLAAIDSATGCHQIPLPPHENPELSISNMRLLMEEIFTFLRQRPNGVPRDSRKKGPDVMPPLYVADKNEKVIKSVVRTLLLEHTDYDEDYLRIYSLPFLFYVLRNASHRKISETEDPFISVNIPKGEIEKDIYEYVRSISCTFHNLSDAYHQCSLSKAVRLAYLICDHCCGDLDIPLIPGRHVPISSRPAALASRPSSRAIINAGPPVEAAAQAIARIESSQVQARPLLSSQNQFQLQSLIDGDDIAIPGSSSSRYEERLRRPLTTSRVMQSSRNNMLDYETEFPSLGRISFASGVTTCSRGAVPRGLRNLTCPGSSSSLDTNSSQNSFRTTSRGRGRGYFGNFGNTSGSYKK